MTPKTLDPNHRLRSKFRLIVFFWFLFIAAMTVPFGAAIGYGVTETGTGAAFGAFIGLIVNLIWLPIALWSVDRYYESLHYELRDDEIIVNVGIWTKTVKHVPFRTITNIAIKRDPLDRLLYNLGTLEIQTAGANTTQTSSAEEALLGLVDYEGVYESVADALRQYRGSPMSPNQASTDGGALSGTAALESGAVLGELRAIRELLAQRNTGA